MFLTQTHTAHQFGLIPISWVQRHTFCFLKGYLLQYNVCVQCAWVFFPWKISVKVCLYKCVSKWWKKSVLVPDTGQCWAWTSHSPCLQWPHRAVWGDQQLGSPCCAKNAWEIQDHPGKGLNPAPGCQAELSRGSGSPLGMIIPAPPSTAQCL